MSILVRINDTVESSAHEHRLPELGDLRELAAIAKDIYGTAGREVYAPYGIEIELGYDAKNAKCVVAINALAGPQGLAIYKATELEVAVGLAIDSLRGE